MKGTASEYRLCYRALKKLLATQEKTNFYMNVFYRFHGNDIDTL